MIRAAAIACLALAGCSAHAQPTSPCQPDPYGGRALFLRGTHNAWGATPEHQMRWACNRHVWVGSLQGEHRFKVGDEAWSGDADWGAPRQPPLNAVTLAHQKPQGAQRQGAPFVHRFQGIYRITMNASLNPNQSPTVTLQACSPQAPPWGATTLYLRGSMNANNAMEAFAFQWACDAYYLNVDLQGLHQFKVADSAWNPALTFGAGVGGRNTPAVDHRLDIVGGAPRGDERGGGRDQVSPPVDLQFAFGGQQTLKLGFDGPSGLGPHLTISALNFADPKAKPVTHPVALGLRHDSRAVSDKSPFGAVPEGSTVTFALHAPAGVAQVTLVVQQRTLTGNQETLDYQDRARVRMTRQGARWVASHRFDHKAIYGYWFDVTLDEAGQRFVVHNNDDAVPWTREKGSNGVGAVSPQPEDTRAIRRFRLTVHDPRASVPSWAADAIYYYIFPERFRNGDRANDPKPGVARYQDQAIEVHPRWMGRPSKPGRGDGFDAIYNNDFFGGDLAGILQKLDHIRELGANTIYMTPIFKAASNHKYDHADYLQVDPAFGDNALFTQLTQAAAQRGIRVVVDASLNHTGSDSVYFNRYGNHGLDGAFQGGRVNPASPYASWYRFNPSATASPGPSPSDPASAYQGWVGIADLPELDKASPDWRRFAYGADDSVTRTWLRRGASGWRMDVAPWVPDDFWREWRRAVKATDPEAITIAETWFDSSKYFLGDMFDSTMNYIFRNAVQDFAAGGDAARALRSLELLREVYPEASFHALMNLLSTHDQPRALHVFGDLGDASDAAAKALAKRRLRLAVSFQMAYPGAPTVYYGDEVGVTGGEDPDNRAPYPWADEGGQPDEAWHAEMKRLIAMRKRHPVLVRGRLAAPLHSDANTVALAREHEGSWSLSVFNNAMEARPLDLALPPALQGRVWRDAQTGAEVTTPVGATWSLQVPAMGALILVSSPR